MTCDLLWISNAAGFIADVTVMNMASIPVFGMERNAVVKEIQVGRLSVPPPLVAPWKVVDNHCCRVDECDIFKRNVVLATRFAMTSKRHAVTLVLFQGNDHSCSL